MKKSYWGFGDKCHKGIKGAIMRLYYAYIAMKRELI